jgi:hypothetical protein
VISLKGRKEVQDKGVIAFRNWSQSASIYEAKQSQNQTTNDNNNNADNVKDENEDENEAMT